MTPKFVPKPETLALLRVSGNPLNGLGETEKRPPSPFFWHPPDKHPYADLQNEARKSSRKCPGAGEWFKAAYQHPSLVPIAEQRRQGTPEQLAAAVKEFALANDAEDIGMVRLDPLWVFDGYELKESWVIVLAFAHNYDQLKQVPSNEHNGAGIADVGLQYARGTKASFALANWIRGQGFSARAYPGPAADALLLIPPAIASGLGELGKHGSMISRKFGSGFRLAGVTTDMPLVPSVQAPDVFGADEFCANCQVCMNACPPGAISESKQLVRGESRWYVNFDKCIPYFVEEASCGVCIAVCPWTRPNVRPNLLAKMAKRMADKADTT